MRLLYVTTIGITMRFFQTLIKELLDSGNIVDIACNETTSEIPDCYRQWGCNVFSISWERSPFSLKNLEAITQIRSIVNKGHYDIVHCHTPIAAACTRIACRSARKHGTKVIYTAHGFHFYKGAPLKNWIIYYPIEKLCAHWTDVLITINKEDYNLAQRKIKARRVEYVPGVGIDTEKFEKTQVDLNAKRKEIGIPKDAFLLLSVGELNDNKNHQIVVRAIAELDNSNVHYAIAGKGDQKDILERLATELGIDKQFHLLGYRNDVPELYKVSDVYVLPSIREGLNVSVMEAMASTLPCVVSGIRGNVDLIDEHGGVLFNPDSVEDCRRAIRKIFDADSVSMGEYNRKKSKEYDFGIINNRIEELYDSVSVQ